MRSALLVIGASGVLIGCGASDGDAASNSQNIAGGAPASATSLNAVGALADDGSFRCTGTLVTPTKVLTAQHCGYIWSSATADKKTHPKTDFVSVTFQIGPEFLHPTRTVKVSKIASTIGDPAYEPSDVAVFTLSEPVTDIPPIRISEDQLGKRDIGSPFTAVGYGLRQPKEGGAALPHVRTMATLRLTKLDAPMHEGYEAFFEPNADGALTCAGDSGSPLLQKRNGSNSILGVLSAGDSGTNTGRCGSFGSTYATFGPTTLKFLRSEGVLPAKDTTEEDRP